MAKTFFENIRNIFLDQKDQLNVALTDAERDGRVNVALARQQIATWNQEILGLSTTNQENQTALKEAQEKSAAFQGFAEKAAQAKNPDDVRRALEQKAPWDTRVTELTAQIAQNQKLLEDKRAQRQAAEAKVADADGDLARLKVKLSNNKSRQENAGSQLGLGQADSPLSRLDEIKSAANQSDARTAAMEEEVRIRGTENGGDLAAKYGTPASTAIDDQVKAMMAKAAGTAS